MNKFSLCLCAFLSLCLAENNFSVLEQGYIQEEAPHSESLDPLLHGYLHEDGEFCDSENEEILYFTYNQKENTFTPLDMKTFVEPQGFAPLQSEETFAEVEAKFIQSHSQEEYEGIKVSDIAYVREEPNILYIILVKPLKKGETQ